MDYAPSETEIKRDADHISTRLGAILKVVESCTADLERQGNKLFGYQPEPSAPKSDRSPDNMTVLNLLDELDRASIELRSQANRF